ncbi:hypothetical protein MMC14_004107 [Varicellaria rhodocarpa]|nr:hypothetical protein [Varicellaria rhodocarpa]
MSAFKDPSTAWARFSEVKEPQPAELDEATESYTLSVLWDMIPESLFFTHATLDKFRDPHSSLSNYTITASSVDPVTSSTKFKVFLTGPSSGLLTINGNTGRLAPDSSMTALSAVTYDHIVRYTTAIVALHWYEPRKEKIQGLTPSLAMLKSLAIQVLYGVWHTNEAARDKLLKFLYRSSRCTVDDILDVFRAALDIQNSTGSSRAIFLIIDNPSALELGVNVTKVLTELVRSSKGVVKVMITNAMQAKDVGVFDVPTGVGDYVKSLKMEWEREQAA